MGYRSKFLITVPKIKMFGIFEICITFCMENHQKPTFYNWPEAEKLKHFQHGNTSHRKRKTLRYFNRDDLNTFDNGLPKQIFDYHPQNKNK